LLIEPQVDREALPEQVDDQRLGPELGPEEMQTGIVEVSHNFAEQDVDFAFPLADDDVKAKQPEDGKQDGNPGGQTDKRDAGGDQEAGKISHGSPS